MGAQIILIGAPEPMSIEAVLAASAAAVCAAGRAANAVVPAPGA